MAVYYLFVDYQRINAAVIIFIQVGEKRCDV